MMIAPALQARLVSSLAASIGSDLRMWTLDASYRASRISGGMCIQRANVRPYSPSSGCVFPYQIDCDYSTYELDVRCTPANSQGLMWQYPRYAWARAKLQNLLASKPEAYPTAARARAWAQWCWDVASLVSLARWSTNIRDASAGKIIPGSTGTSSDVWDSTPYLLPLEGPKVAAWRERTFALRTASRYGDHAAGETVFPIRIRNWNRAGHGWKRDNSGAIVLSPPDLPKGKADFGPMMSSWPLSWANPLGSRPDSLGVSRPYYTATRPSSDFETLVDLFRFSGERQSFVPVTWATPHDRRHSTAKGTYLSAEGTVGYLTALAEDAVIDRSYAKWVSNGIKVWNDAFIRIPGDYRRNRLGSLEQFAQLSIMANEAKADEAFAAMQLGLSTAGGLVSTIPVVGWAAGLMIAVVQALLVVTNEILKATDSYATGAGAIPVCPPPPVVRVIRGGQECDWDSSERDGVTREELERQIVSITGPGSATTGTTPTITSPNALRLPESSVVRPRGGGGGGVLAVGAGALLALLLAKG